MEKFQNMPKALENWHEKYNKDFGSLKLYASANIYVSVSGNDITGDGTSSKSYATVQKALSSIPKNLNGYSAVINVSSGTFDVPDAVVTGYFGGSLSLVGTGGSTVFNISGARFDFTKSQSLSVKNIIFDGNGIKTGRLYVIDTAIRFDSCTFKNLEYGISAFQGAKLTCYNCVFENNHNAVRCSYGSNATVENGSGVGNDVVLIAQGTIINASTEIPSGTTLIAESNGGRVFRGN